MNKITIVIIRALISREPYAKLRTMKIITRAEALKEKLPSYFTGKSCKNGHVAERRTVGGNCSVCHNQWRESKKAEDPERFKLYNQNYYRKHRSKYIEKANNRNREFRQRSFDHEREDLLRFYDACPEGHEVDHEIPINHPLVCGLHCLANLQYLSTGENREKSNKWTQE